MTAMRGTESAFWNPAGLASLDGSRFVLPRRPRGGDRHRDLRALRQAGRGHDGRLVPPPGRRRPGAHATRDGNQLGTSRSGTTWASPPSPPTCSAAWTPASTSRWSSSASPAAGICPDAGTTATTYAIDAGIQLTPTATSRSASAPWSPTWGRACRCSTPSRPTRCRRAARGGRLRRAGHARGRTGRAGLGDRGGPGAACASRATSRSTSGTELQAGVADALFLRAGYVAGDLGQEDGARVGLGLRFQRFDLAHRQVPRRLDADRGDRAGPRHLLDRLLMRLECPRRTAPRPVAARSLRTGTLLLLGDPRLRLARPGGLGPGPSPAAAAGRSLLLPGWGQHAPRPATGLGVRRGRGRAVGVLGGSPLRRSGGPRRLPRPGVVGGAQRVGQPGGRRLGLLRDARGMDALGRLRRRSRYAPGVQPEADPATFNGYVWSLARGHLPPGRRPRRHGGSRLCSGPRLLRGARLRRRASSGTGRARMRSWRATRGSSARATTASTARRPRSAPCWPTTSCPPTDAFLSARLPVEAGPAGRAGLRLGTPRLDLRHEAVTMRLRGTR